MSKSICAAIALGIALAAGAGHADTPARSAADPKHAAVPSLDTVAREAHVGLTPGLEPAPGRMSRIVDAVRRVPLRPRRIGVPVRHRLDPEPAPGVVVKLRF